MEFNHYSVMLRETIEYLNIRPDGIYLDGTLGGGGHAREICGRLESGHFYGIDQDDAAIAAAGQRLADFSDRVTLIRSNYRNARAVLRERGVEQLNGIVLDLGVSSYQLDGQRYSERLQRNGVVSHHTGLWRRQLCQEYSETYRERQREGTHRDHRTAKRDHPGGYPREDAAKRSSLQENVSGYPHRVQSGIGGTAGGPG